MNFGRSLVWQQSFALLRKECLEIWRDRRAVFTAMITCLLLPTLSIGGIVYAVKNNAEDRLRLALLSREAVPFLERQLAGARLEVKTIQEGAPKALLENGFDLVLEVGDNFNSAFRNLLVPKLYLYMDSSAKGIHEQVSYLQRHLGEFQSIVARQRLIARGVAPQVLIPWQLEVRDVSAPSERGALLLTMMPSMLILGIFVACLGASIDSSAGERERLSLEVLLQQPLAGSQIVLAKVLAVSSIGWLSGLVGIAGMVSVLPLLPLSELGIQYSVSLYAIPVMGLLLLPLSLLVAVAQILLALRSQSFKDAQMQLGLLQIVPLLILFGLDMSKVDLEAPVWQLVPLVGQQQWLKALLVGETISLPLAIAGSLVTLSMAGLCILVGAGALQRERLLGAT
ncbi:MULTISPECIES: ABC transporter permease [unclassified Microbulbifer]|uniref:ABC transporter permease subunit n=1 Tax=Microbulbifer spongiae TaxID=2944933 RepID=A0ABY9EF73_9GAMM|nr:MULTISPECIES: ABC transporter permease subunit [unclassified Microbulbifer]MDP5208380.1 ABC transporter permease subunit [Microbulbifer sp. 2205BS26-8]WKD49401.1 ABC transporter permease subunit [Microbulbifer sp. MI-G]